MNKQVLAQNYLSENNQAVINTYVKDYLEETEEDAKKSEEVVASICKDLKEKEAKLYKKEHIHPDTFSRNSILGVEKEYFRKVKLIEDIMKCEIHSAFKDL